MDSLSDLIKYHSAVTSVMVIGLNVLCVPLVKLSCNFEDVNLIINSISRRTSTTSQTEGGPGAPSVMLGPLLGAMSR